MVICVLYGSNDYAQSTRESVDLKMTLLLLEENFDVTFSYLNEYIDGIEVQLWQMPFELKDYLKYIEKQTNLKFTRLDNRYYAISMNKVGPSMVCGYLKHYETGLPLSQVSVTSGYEHTISKENGYFELVGQQLGDQIQFRHIGFETTFMSTRILQKDSCSTITLRERLSALDEVIVHNYIAKGIEKKLNGAYKVSNEQLQVLPGIFDQDVMQSLQVLPGVYSAYESVADINIRGGTGDQNLTFWDGIRLYQTGHFFGLISVFNPYFTSEVSLTKNATPAAYGESVSSVIDVQGKSEHAESFAVQGGVNMLNVDVEADVPLSEKTSVFIGARQSISGLLQTPTYDQYYERAFGDIFSSNYTSADTLQGKVENFEYRDVGVKVVHVPSPTARWELSMVNIEDQLDFAEKINTSGALSKESNVDQLSQGMSLTFQKKWSQRWSMKSQGYYSHYNLRSSNHDFVNDQLLEQENEIRDWQVRTDVSCNLSDRLTWTNGYSFNERGITNKDELNSPSFRRRIKEVMRNHALYSEAVYSSEGKSTIASLGVRLNYFESLNRQIIEPRLLINHKLNDKWALELAGELKSQTSLQVIDLQNDFLGVEKRRWIQSNDDDLPVLTSRQLSSGLLFMNKGWQLTLEGYLKHVSGIVTSSQSFQNQFEFVRSTGEYNITGLDVLVSYRVEKISAWMSYTISRNMNRFRELLSDEFPGKVDIRHFVTSGINYSSNKIECSLGINWHTGNPYTKPSEDLPIVDGAINYQFPNSSNLPVYLRVDWAAKFKFLIAQKIKSQIGISIWNVTNETNPVNAYYAQNESGSIVEVFENGLGFTPNIMIRMAF